MSRTWAMIGVAGFVFAGCQGEGDIEVPTPGDVGDAALEVEWSGKVFLEPFSDRDAHVLVPYNALDGLSCIAMAMVYEPEGPMEPYEIGGVGNYTVTASSSDDESAWNGDLWNYNQTDGFWYIKGDYEYFVEGDLFRTNLTDTDESFDLYLDTDPVINPEELIRMAGDCTVPGGEATPGPIISFGEAYGESIPLSEYLDAFLAWLDL